MTKITISRKKLFTQYTLIGLLSIILSGGSVWQWWRILTDFETVEEADDLVVNYLNNSNLMKVTENVLGGTFPKDSIYKSGDGRVGVRLWYCYNETDNRYPKIFLASERLPSYSFPSEQDTPYYPILAAMDAASSFSYKPTGQLAKGDGYRYISNTSQTAGKMVGISKMDVIDFSQAFKNKIANVKYPFAFFFYDNTNHFGKLLSQPRADLVRYYFSFDDLMKVNKIRVLLVAARSDGTNIADSNPSRTDPPILLQKSVPPPPEY